MDGSVGADVNSLGHAGQTHFVVVLQDLEATEAAWRSSQDSGAGEDWKRCQRGLDGWMPPVDRLSERIRVAWRCVHWVWAAVAGNECAGGKLL